MATAEIETNLPSSTLNQSQATSVAQVDVGIASTSVLEDSPNSLIPLNAPSRRAVQRNRQFGRRSVDLGRMQRINFIGSLIIGVAFMFVIIAVVSENSGLEIAALQRILDSTNFTSEEILMWFRIFRSISTDNRMSQEQFINIYKFYYTTSKKPEELAKHVYKVFDLDDDGYNDFLDFILEIDAVFSRSLVTNINWAFRLFDMNFSGFISKEEMDAIIVSFIEFKGEDFINAIYHDKLTAQERSDKIFKSADHNGNGYLNIVEFGYTYLGHYRFIYRSLITFTKEPLAILLQEEELNNQANKDSFVNPEVI